MSKKRQKSATSMGIPKWEQALLSTNFVDDNWNASIALVVGAELEDYNHIRALIEAVQAGTRRLFSVFSQEELFQQVKELGNPKAKKTKDTPQHSEVCEPCKLYLDGGEDIPLPLLAKLIKFKLLNVKQNDHRRRDAEKKAAAEKGKGQDGKGKKERGKSPAKKAGKKTPEPPSPKKESKLRKRGEEDLDSKYIDDEPDDGVKHYVVMCGFNHPHILRYLDEVGIHVDSIIKIESEDYSRFIKPPEPEVIPIDGTVQPPPEKDEKTLALEEAERQQKEKDKKLLGQFWMDVLPIMQQAPNTSKLHDVARLRYTVNNDVIPDDMEDNELRTAFGVTLYEAVAVLMYDLLDARRIWRTYLANMRQLHVYVNGEPYQPPIAAGGEDKSQISAPTPAVGGQPVAPSTVPGQEAPMTIPQEVDMRFYRELMNAVPQESVSVPLVMHCMLEQIQATEEGRLPPSEQPKTPRTDGLDPTLASHISAIAFKLALTQDEKKALSSEFDVPEGKHEPRTQPLLVNMQDDITLRTFDLRESNGFDPKLAEREMLKYLPFNVELPHPTSRAAKERASRLQELIHFCATDGLTQAEIDRAFKQFVFECMDLTTVDENGIIVAKAHEGYEGSVVPWDDPYPFFKGMVQSPVRPEQPRDLLNPNMPVEGYDELGGVTPRSEGEVPHSDSAAMNEAHPTSQPMSKDGSRPGSASILKSPRPGSSKSRLSTHSVHFEKDAGGVPVPAHVVAQALEQQAATAEPDKSLEESMGDVVEAQRRDLDQWCFAEHFEPEVLLQVLKGASYSLPYMDTYYHKRDHSLLVVLHNPCNAQLQSHVDWETNLHSNVGFRNYLEHVSDSIWEWAQAEEAKYQATLLAQEVEKTRVEDENASRPSSGTKSKKRGDRSKSPKKSDSKSKSRSRSRSEERPSSAQDDPFVRANSLKAYKQEQDIIKAEEEEKQKQAEEKRARSAQKKREKQLEKEEKEKADKKRPGSRGSAKSLGRSSKEPKESLEALPEGDDGPVVEEKFWPFTGYDVSNDLIHASGVTSTLFPSDGGQIRTERVQFVQGTTSVKTCVMKDGHAFMMHVLNPKDPAAAAENEDEESGQDAGMEKADLEKPEKDEVQERPESEAELRGCKEDANKPAVGAFGSFSAQMCDGMCISLSTYGHTGEAKDGQGHEPEPYIPPARSPSPQPPSPSKGKKADKGKDKTPPTPEPQPEEEVKVEEKEEDQKIDQPFQQLHITCPDGLSVTWYLESSTGITPQDEEDRRILVRQNYPFKTSGIQPTEALRKAAMEETARVINSEGTVIKTMKDESVVVMFSDGSVSEFSTMPSSLLPADRSESPQRPSSGKSDKDRETPSRRVGSRMSRKTSHLAATNKEEEPAREEKLGQWITTAPSGERVATRADGTVIPGVKPALCSLASDPHTDQTMSTREDHTIMVTYPDGTTITEHGDKTRITTYYKTITNPIDYHNTQETGEDMGNEEHRIKFVMVECPGYATVTFNCETSECITSFGSGTRIHTYRDGGYDVDYHDGGMLLIDSEGCAMYRPRPNNDIEFLLPNQDHVYVMRHYADVICETVDNEGNVFNVKNTGDTVVMTTNGEPIDTVEVDEENGNALDQTDTPLKTHRKIVQYKQHAPRFFIIHSNGSGTELLRYQDVADYLSNAENDATVAVLNDPLPDFPGVNGITILKPYTKTISEKWMKKYEKTTIMPEGLMSRNLKNLPSREEKKPGLKFGTNVGQGLAVGTALPPPPPSVIFKCPSVLELRQLIQYSPMDKTLRDNLQGGLREYAEFVNQRNEEASLHALHEPRDDGQIARADELTALVKDDDLPHLEDANIKALYEKVTAPPPPSPPPTPAPQRSAADWEQDRRELAEEIQGRQALRKHKIPPYFESEMGKAFLLTQAPDGDSITKALDEDTRRAGNQAAVRSCTPSSGEQHPPQQDSDGYLSSAESPEKSRYYYTPITPGESPQKMMHGYETPSNLRPGAPTPAHAAGQGSPAPLRPGNPTPAQGMKENKLRPDNPTPRQSGDADPNARTDSGQAPVPPIPEESPVEMQTPSSNDFLPTRSLEVTVTGEPRRDPVHVPAYIQSDRPMAKSNDRFKQIENPVRRKVKTSSVAGANNKGASTLDTMRGFELLPNQVDFGFLREGYTYQFIVHLKNTGIDSCRYKVRQPPPSTGMKVVYKPGPVAAGMKASLAVEIYAIAVGVEGESGVGRVTHSIEIVTETDTIYLPVVAHILTPDEYDSRSPRSPHSCKSPGVKLTNTKPPSREGIIRPRRDDVPESGMTMADASPDSSKSAAIH